MAKHTACNICGGSELHTLNGRENAFCKSCGSYERTRVLKLFVDEFRLDSSHRVLHIGPERGLSKYIKSVTSSYIPIDYDTERYSHIPELLEFDLCNFDNYKSLDEFDLIIHSHIIEHVRCNYSAVLVKLHKLLKNGGRHLFCLPIYGKGFEEDLTVSVGDEALRRFGQDDHVRRFSPHDLHATLGAIFTLPDNYDLYKRFPDIDPEAIGVPKRSWTGFTGDTVFCLRAGDLRI